MAEARGGVDLVGHTMIRLSAGALGPLSQIDNLVVQPPKEEHRWIGTATAKVGEWRAALRSTYIRWALAINGLEVAADKYADSTWRRNNNQFFVHGLGASGIEVLSVWDGQTASEAHRKTMPMLAAFGIIDLYAGLEEVVFDLYRTYLDQHRRVLLKGDECRPLRQLMRAASSDATQQPAWEKAWSERLNKWQRKKLYDGLADVFRSFCRQTGLKEPSTYKHTTVDTWCEAIDAIAILRHCLVHGAKVVPPELASFSSKPYRLTFDFKENEPLAVTLTHLMGVQLFCEQILSAVNVSLAEMALGPPAPPTP